MDNASEVRFSLFLYEAICTFVTCDANTIDTTMDHMYSNTVTTLSRTVYVVSRLQLEGASEHRKAVTVCHDTYCTASEHIDETHGPHTVSFQEVK